MYIDTNNYKQNNWQFENDHKILDAIREKMF